MSLIQRYDVTIHELLRRQVSYDACLSYKQTLHKFYTKKKLLMT